MEISEQRKTKCLFSQRVYSNAREALTRAATDFGFDLRRVVSLNKKNTFIKVKRKMKERNHRGVAAKKKKTMKMNWSFTTSLK